MDIRRCQWLKLNNLSYVKYHDEEWGKPQHDDRALYEMLILETFQAGLSWECILNKRPAFKKAYDNFNVDKVACYDESKINSLLSNPDIIRNRLKITASVTNSKVFKQIQQEFGSFDRYIWHFTNGKTIIEPYTKRTTSPLSDKVSLDLKKRGMSFVGSTTIYSFLQSIGVINAHGEECFLNPRKSPRLFA